LDLLEIDIAGRVGLHCIDGWGVHLHDLLDGTYLKGDQHRGAFAHCYREVLLPKRRKALLLYANCVFTGGQHRYDELAFASTLEFALQASADIDNFDLGPFHHSSLRISDGPIDCSGTELTLAESQRNQNNTQKTETDDTSHDFLLPDGQSYLSGDF